MEDLPETLREIERLRDISDEAVATLGQRCQWRHYTAGQEIFGYHEQSTDVCFIVKGQVRVTIFSLSGKEVSFRDMSGGQTFGELSAIDGESRSANVVAVTNSLIASMTAKEYWRAVEEYPEFAAANLKALSKLVRNLTARIFEFSTLAVKNRIHAEILRLGRRHDAGDNTALISPLPTHEEMANRISTHREAVTRELNALAASGVVQKRSEGLLVCDMKQLAMMVEEVQGE